MRAAVPRVNEGAFPSPLDDTEMESREYWRSFLVVAVAHGIVVLGLVVASLFAPPKKNEEIVWLSGGELGGGEMLAAAELIPPPEPVIEAPPEPVPEPPKPEAPVKSDLVVPQATPKPTPKPATPQPKAATPKPKPATPKPAPKKKEATPRPTPKTKPSTPKEATPKPKPKEAKESESKKSPPKSETPKSADDRTDAQKKAAALAAGVGKPGGAKTGSGSGTGTTGKGPGAGKPSDFGDYFSLLRDRFYAVWNQPTNLDRSDGDLVTTLRIKVKRDGTVLGFEITKSSGNSLMDGSVLAAAQQTTKIDPLPDGLGSGDEVEIPINFRLDQAP